MNTEINPTAHIVIIDDEESICCSYVDELVWRYGYDINKLHCFTDPREALQYIKANHSMIDVVLLDLKMPEFDGLEMLRHIRVIDDGIKIIVISAFAGIDAVKTAVQASSEESEILQKAVDKPITDFPKLVAMIAEAYQARRGSYDN